MSSSSSSEALLPGLSRSELTHSTGSFSRVKMFFRRLNPFATANPALDSPVDQSFPLLASVDELVATEGQQMALHSSISDLHKKASDVYGAFIGQVTHAFGLSGAVTYVMRPELNCDDIDKFIWAMSLGFVGVFVASILIMCNGFNAMMPNITDLERKKAELTKKATKVLNQEAVREKARALALRRGQILDETNDVLDHEVSLVSMKARCEKIINSKSGLNLKCYYICLLVPTTVCVVAYGIMLVYIAIHSFHSGMACL